MWPTSPPARTLWPSRRLAVEQVAGGDECRHESLRHDGAAETHAGKQRLVERADVDDARVRPRPPPQPFGRYILEAYGRLPCGVDAIHMLGLMQTHHIDTAFYDTFFSPGAYGPTQAGHMASWHP